MKVVTQADAQALPGLEARLARSLLFCCYADHYSCAVEARAALRLATLTDASAIDTLMKAAIRDILPSFYDARQSEASIRFIGSRDRTLIEDETYSTPIP